MWDVDVFDLNKYKTIRPGPIWPKMSKSSKRSNNKMVRLVSDQTHPFIDIEQWPPTCLQNIEMAVWGSHERPYLCYRNVAKLQLYLSLGGSGGLNRCNSSSSSPHGVGGMAEATQFI